MNSREYWSRREDEQLKQNITDEREYDRELKRIYQNMLDACQKEIDSFYGKYAAAEEISLAEAKKRVSKHDVKAFERKAAKYVKDKDFSPKANEELRLYNATMKINRLEMLKANIGLETIAGHEELEKFMAGVLKGRTKAELKRQAGILGKTVKNNAAKADAIVNGSFKVAKIGDKSTFSDRIWQYQDLMRQDIGKLLQQGLIQGKGARAIAKDLKKYWYGPDPKTGGGATYCMERLMRTELARVQTEAQKQSFQRNGFDKYIFIINHHASKHGCCSLCEEIAKKKTGFSEDGVYLVKDMMPGENAPPMHPHCRCSVAAWEDDEEYEAWLDYLANGGSTAEWDAKGKAEWLKQRNPNAETGFTEIKDALDFAYGDFTKEDYIKWADAYDKLNSGVKLSAEELKIIEDYTEGSFISLNDVCRYSDAELLKKGYTAEDITRIRGKADMLSKTLSKYNLDTNIVTHRFERDVSWLTGNGNGVEELEKLIGTEYTADGFTSSGMFPNRFRFTGGKKDAVHFEIVTPAGTDGAFLSMSKKGEEEFLYNRSTKFHVIDGGERIVKEMRMNYNTWQMEEVEITERFLKVQVIPQGNVKNALKTSAIDNDDVSSVVEAASVKRFAKAKAFTPAKTIEEAEAFAKQFVDESQFGAMGVSYAGVNIEVANDVNRALNDVYSTMNVPKLGGVAAPAKNTKLGKQVNSHAAYSPVRKSILMDRNKTKKASTFLSGLEEDKKAIANILNHPERYDFSKLSPRLRKIIDASSTTGRSIVAETVPEAIIHELGHHIERSMSKDDWDVIKAGMDTYATNISGYAVDGPSEYLAESFAAYMKGEDCIDPELRKIFDKMRL